MRKRDVYSLLFRIIALAFFVFAFLRIVFIFRFGNFSAFLQNVDALPLFLFNAFRFDAQVIAYFLLPVVPWLIAGVFISAQRFVAKSRRFFSLYFPSVLTLTVLLSLMDQQFYLNFLSHFNPVFFDFLNEEPGVLIVGIWNEHPVLLMIMVAVLGFVLFRFLINRVLVKPIFVYGLAQKQYLLSILFFMLLPLAVRGSLSTFPLRAEDTYVSDKKDINDFVANSVFMLKKAWSEKKKEFKTESEEQILRHGGFRTINDAVAACFGISADSAAQKSLEEWIFSTTTSSSSLPKMNVVLIVVESWSNRLIDYQSEKMDLLRTMEPHLKEGILFRNFQSSTNGTINAVETLVTGTPYQPLFTSKFRYISYPTSITSPFKQNGYHAEFISGIELSWRNLEEVLPLQGFDRVMGKYQILREFPDVECNQTWGVYDHSMLDVVFQKLDTQSQPNFFFCLTSTSHTPFEFPADYPLPEILLNGENDPRFVGDSKMVKEYLKGYQYTNQALGDFMTRIKSSPKLSENTVVVITGDHNIRMILPYVDDDSRKFQYSVPLYIYLPEVLSADVEVDTSVYGSHSDIIPTLVPLLFQGTRFFGMGQNLLDSMLKAEKSISINVSQVQHGADMTDVEAQRVADARNTILKLYFQRLFNENKKSLGGNK